MKVPTAPLTAHFMLITRLSIRASFIAQLVKNLPAVQEARVRSLGREDPLEKEMATHSSIIAWWAAVHGVAKSQPQLSD